jgi:hypothetical protein
MNRTTLRDLLVTEDIREDAYDLDGGHLPEKYTLSQSNKTWFVYYSERGLETGKRAFSSEDEACEYLLESLRNDPTTRKNRRA